MTPPQAVLGVAALIEARAARQQCAVTAALIVIFFI
jgi:hypothetical protein